MVRDNSQKIDEQVQKQNDEFYGEEAPGGHAADLETDDNAADPLEKFIGNKPSKELDIADEIEEDEEDLHTMTSDDSDNDSNMYSDNDGDDDSDDDDSDDTLSDEDL